HRYRQFRTTVRHHFREAGPWDRRSARDDAPPPTYAAARPNGPRRPDVRSSARRARSGNSAVADTSGCSLQHRARKSVVVDAYSRADHGCLGWARIKTLVLVVGTSRCDVPGRVQRAERTRQDARAAAHVAPLYAARTAQRAVPTTLTGPSDTAALQWNSMP